ncbi:hypothetical protein A3H85_00750 [Candidatus Daviesbacteria bacterium RIFCSPLOWO2_02_FULL_40_8]|uniref:Uncharacterized protein n=1 Tax=Candidatus Daviesbacteria bacterium RIFCSPLOWO2_01_FULL_40_24 TaxID=1797787 RepID=A0A1F5MJQ0_9BACT|nr:MAG: hypothetical protein A2780_01755 [Candidatus Daviesbacteria bacterium RIFCSPHIGHO2_01_FULL_41_45]OGE35373.1 MAG: hypothetical protein A3C32_01825 [Candidatus Daviesbacteria bacterium RIFCSPHIGHO2_02_FULL_41_14]OGE65616.1 MAG: hypothetical protein A3B49_02925 [Candidatus Daviesbacteria bacterium RIFCSPLOWO2_01_FULL_40_24]OGE67052.1 MAG: hypothetical protein A3H85_00750 [Candidatus Daviesbacteria bacterium RIFCSPLOWO2_02_FULL_40_8]
MENTESQLGKITGDPMQRLSNMEGITRGCEFLGWEEVQPNGEHGRFPRVAIHESVAIAEVLGRARGARKELQKSARERLLSLENMS